MDTLYLGNSPSIQWLGHIHSICFRLCWKSLECSWRRIMKPYARCPSPSKMKSSSAFGTIPKMQTLYYSRNPYWAPPSKRFSQGSLISYKPLPLHRKAWKWNCLQATRYRHMFIHSLSRALNQPYRGILPTSLKVIGKRLIHAA